MGLACAQAWILFMIVAFFTFVIFKILRVLVFIMEMTDDQGKGFNKNFYLFLVDPWRCHCRGATLLAGTQLPDDSKRVVYLSTAVLADGDALGKLCRCGGCGQFSALL
jgi:hypothetical protein